MTARDVAAAARTMVTRDGCRAIFLDHLGELDVESGKHDRHDLAVSEAVRHLRDVAKDFRIPVVVLAHFNRPQGRGEKEPRFVRPTSTAWANSAGVERMARVAVGLWLSEDHGQDYVMGTVLKQTRGAKDIDFAMSFDRPSGLVLNTGGFIPTGTRGHDADGGDRPL